MNQVAMIHIAHLFYLLVITNEKVFDQKPEIPEVKLFGYCFKKGEKK